MIGIDAVDVERLRAVIHRSPGIERRLFTHAERTYCHSLQDPVVHLAGTLAVKEAVIKAAGLGPLSVWGRRIEVHRDRSGSPRVEVADVKERGFAISISHDGPVAVAVAVATGPVSVPARNGLVRDDIRLQPNLQLMRYLAPLGDSRKVALLDAPAADVSFAGTDFP